MTDCTAGAGVTVEGTVVAVPQAVKTKTRLRVNERTAVNFFMDELLSIHRLLVGQYLTDG
jgi:hypothetical protein